MTCNVFSGTLNLNQSMRQLSQNVYYHDVTGRIKLFETRPALHVVYSNWNKKLTYPQRKCASNVTDSVRRFSGAICRINIQNAKFDTQQSI